VSLSVGIDLGTTNSVLSVLEAGKPVVVASAEGARLVPSVVAFTESGETIVGELAKRQAVTNPERTFRSFKRAMGTDASYQVDSMSLSPQELSARVLMKLRRDAEAFLTEPVTQVVVSVPAYFSDAQRQATLEAGRIAGLEVLRLVPEPTAAALSYGLDRYGSGAALVFDLGGGTLDVSALELSPGRLEVRAVAGDVQLGGDDFDQAVIDAFVARLVEEFGTDPSEDRTAMQRLRDAAEQIKIELSSVTRTQVTLPFLTVDAAGEPVHFAMTVTRDQFNRWTAPLVERIAGPVKQVLADLGVSGVKLDHVVMVGGASRIPAVREKLRSLLGGRELPAAVNPEEAVALGAALQAGMLTGEVKDVLLLDVTPLALGVETKGGLRFPLIGRNTTIPTSRTELFTTDVDNQTQVTVRVLQGERPLAQDNRVLGEFALSGITPAPRGKSQIEVSFAIDADGILKVSARDGRGVAARDLLITGGSALPEDEVQRMVADAEEFAAADERERARVVLQNQCESLLYETESLLASADDPRFRTVVVETSRAVVRLRDALSGDDDELLGVRRGELQSRYQLLVQQVRTFAAPAAVPDVELAELTALI
jgi:molecular chaperone DnaK